MTRYPRQIDRQYLSCRSRSLTRSTSLTVVLLIFTRISSRAIVGVGTSSNTNCPPYSNNLTAFMRALLESAQWAPRGRVAHDQDHQPPTSCSVNLRQRE